MYTGCLSCSLLLPWLARQDSIGSFLPWVPWSHTKMQGYSSHSCLPVRQSSNWCLEISLLKVLGWKWDLCFKTYKSVPLILYRFFFGAYAMIHAKWIHPDEYILLFLGVTFPTHLRSGHGEEAFPDQLPGDAKIKPGIFFTTKNPVDPILIIHRFVIHGFELTQIASPYWWASDNHLDVTRGSIREVFWGIGRPQKPEVHARRL